MTQKRFSPASRRGGLNRSAMKVASRWIIANIASDDALILPHRANPAGLNFRERQGCGTQTSRWRISNRRQQMPENILILADWKLARLVDDTMPPRDPNGDDEEEEEDEEEDEDRD